MRAIYMADRIIDGIFTYVEVIAARPDLKEGIDAELTRRGKSDLIVGGTTLPEEEPIVNP